MKHLLLLLLISTSICYAQQERIYKLKSNGKKLTKAQVDSLSAAYNNNLQYSMKQEQGQTVVEVDLPSAGDRANDKKTVVASESGTQLNPKKIIYTDTLGNVVTQEVFKEKLKSGIYLAAYQTEEDKITYFLMNKKKAEKESTAQMQNFRNKFISSQFPDFQLKKMDGTEISLASLAGKTVVINFWFIGCKPCIAEMPLLNEVVNHYKDKQDIIFLAPALDAQNELASFLGKHTFTYQILSSAKELTKKLDINSYPTHMIIDSKGIIKELMIGGKENIDKSLIESIDKIRGK